MLVRLGIPYASIRPTLVFGEGDLLLNNMAWAAAAPPGLPRLRKRRLQKFQPVYAEDLAGQVVAAGSQNENTVADAAGRTHSPLRSLLRLLAKAVNARVRLVHTPPSMGFALTRLFGLLLRDVALTRDEVDGLMAGLLTSHAAPDGTTRLIERLSKNVESAGVPVRARSSAPPDTCPMTGEALRLRGGSPTLAALASRASRAKAAARDVRRLFLVGQSCLALTIHLSAFGGPPATAGTAGPAGPLRPP